MMKGPKLVGILQFWLMVNWHRYCLFQLEVLVAVEDLRYPVKVEFGLYCDTISKWATSKIVVQQEPPGYESCLHLQPSLPHLVLLLPLLDLCYREQVLPIRRNRIE